MKEEKIKEKESEKLREKGKKLIEKRKTPI